VTRIPRHLARRIDRLAGRAHAFHRFAHHPLCGAYAPEVLRLGRYRLCVGCTCVALGGASGLLIGVLTPLLSLRALGLIAVVSLGWVWLVFARARVRGMGKLLTRGLPSLMAGFLVTQGLRWSTAWGFLLAAGAALALPLAVLAYRRRGPWRGPCTTCPERDLQPCSGFRPQLRRERAFQRRAGRLLASITVPTPREL